MIEQRVIRTKALLGQDGMHRLESATVMVVGLGAVGGYALEALARSGIGHLILVDFDRFDETNINRQILALTSSIGEKKTDMAGKRVAEINPDCRIELKDICLTPENIDTIFSVTPDYVVDAIDSIGAKCALMAELQKRGIPFISSMGAALKTDASCIHLERLSKTKNCPMARKVRNELKKYGVRLNDIDCVYSDEQCILPENAISKNPEGGRPILGSLPTITAIFGLTIANTIIQRIAKGKENA